MSNSKRLANCFIDESVNLLDQSMAKITHCSNQLSEEQLWWRCQPDLNSIGNLILHLCGNLRQWSIVGIGKLPDNRDRESEFTQRDGADKTTLLGQLSSTVEQAKQTLRDLDETQLLETRSIQEFEVSVLGAISHTTSHFVGHTHQIIYIARLQLGDQYEFHWAPSASHKDVPI